MGRLDDLNDVYNELVAIDFDFTTLPATSKYRKFYEWKTTPSLRALPTGSAQDQGAKVKVGIRPFGLAHDDANKFSVPMSGRAFTTLGESSNNLGALDTIYGITADVTGYIAKPSFVPAKVVLAKKLADSVPVTASDNRITGRAYKKRTGETYTVPFGRAGSTSREFDRQEQIIATVQDEWAVTFKPEKIRRSR